MKYNFATDVRELTLDIINKLELNHIEMLGLNSGKSPISLINGLETMLVISASHMSGNNSSRTVNINYSKGYTNKALRLST